MVGMVNNMAISLAALPSMDDSSWFNWALKPRAGKERPEVGVLDGA